MWERECLCVRSPQPERESVSVCVCVCMYVSTCVPVRSALLNTNTQSKTNNTATRI